MKNVFDIKIISLNEDSRYADRKIGSCVCDPLCCFSESNESSVHAWGAAKAVKSFKGKCLYNIHVCGRVCHSRPND